MRRLAAAALIVAAAFALSETATAQRPGVQVRVLRLVDHSRVAHFDNGASGPRVLLTYLRYPARGRGPYPLVVFAHGFALTPATYVRLLDTWARAGYVVAAPLFPVENANAPGGADERDLVNEPADISFVISRLTATLRTLIDPTEIAVAGHSDGAVAALSVAYDGRYRDRRVDAAMVMSGAALPGFARPGRGVPPLLALQGTADPLNSPSTTASYFALMRRPKFLLWLQGATHRAPYTTDDRYEPLVARATTAFLDHYLKGAPLRPLLRAADSRRGVGRLVADP